MITRPFYYTTLAADPTNADVVYGGAENFYKSTDGGATWTTMRTPHGDNHDMWISPTDGKTMIQSNDGGANVSYDGGRTWSTQINQPTAEIYGVWMDEQFPYRLYGAQQDKNTVIVPEPSASRGDGAVQQRARMRDWTDHSASEESRGRLRRVQGTVRPHVHEHAGRSRRTGLARSRSTATTPRI